MLGAAYGRDAIVRTLIEHGADIDISDKVTSSSEELLSMTRQIYMCVVSVNGFVCIQWERCF